MQKQSNLSPHHRRNIIKVATPMPFPSIVEALYIKFSYLLPPHWIEQISSPEVFVCSDFTNYYYNILLNNITN